ncbi:MAG: hypothetical protein IJU77_03075 [Butyrivibrio sp.]|nr:hypothetical protein [Butyrivibrio sp.]
MTVEELLEKELNEINKSLHILEARRKGKNVDYGSICVKTCRGAHQYRLRGPGDDNYKYVAKADVGKLKVIAQAEFDQRTEKDILAQKRNIERFLCNYDSKGVNSVYERLCTGRKLLVKPLKPTDEMFIEEWKSKNPGCQNTFPIEEAYTTENGENVRSKSELIIANTLYKMNIPYEYEPRLVLGNGKVVYPDFVALNVKERKSVYWEHLGILGDEDYSQKNFSKISTYENSGIFLGHGLIVTMEMPGNPLKTKLIQEKIELYLK